MDDSIKKTIDALTSNGFNVFFLKTKEEALAKSQSLISDGSTIGLGGSISVEQIGLRNKLVELDMIGRNTLYNPYKEGITREESMKMRHLGMYADVYVTGTNAITKKGELVNVDGYGNRVSAQICGPKKVIIICSVNKITDDLTSAIAKIKKHTAPRNAKRLNKNTPCVKTGRCMDCCSDERICNVTTIIHKSNPKGRIKIILVDSELGI
ncbi:MAG: lactate utilization protein [archaeon]